VPIQRALDADSPSGAPGHYEGFLWKKGAVRRNWKKRYFVLDSGKMAYYENRQAYTEGGLANALGFIDVRSLTCRPVIGKYPNCFQIISPARLYFMYTETDTEFVIWKEKLRENGSMWEGRVGSFIQEDDTVSNVRPQFPPAGPSINAPSRPYYSADRIPAFSTPSGPPATSYSTGQIPSFNKNGSYTSMPPAFNTPSQPARTYQSLPQNIVLSNNDGAQRYDRSNYEDHTPNGPRDIGSPVLLSKPNPIVPKAYRQPTLYEPSNPRPMTTSSENLPGRRPAPTISTNNSPAGIRRAPVATVYSSSPNGSYTPPSFSSGAPSAYTTSVNSSLANNSGYNPNTQGKLCTNCNSRWASNVTFCGNCGNRV